jgi:hypothetical protein
MEIIKKQLTKLLDLVEKYPVKMPLSVVAEFLEMNEAGLKAGLMRGNIPFGFAYQKDDGGYRVNVIPTVKFYLWYTNTTGQMLLAADV